MSKIETILSILSTKDLKILTESLTTPLLGGKKLHVDLLLQLSQGKISTARLNVKDRLSISELYRMIEKYLVMTTAANDRLYSHLQLLNYYKENEAEKLFNAVYDDAIPLLSCESFALSSEQAFAKWQFDQLHNRFNNADVQTIIAHHDIAAISSQLKLVITLSSQATLTSGQLDLGLAPILIQYVEDHKLNSIPCIGVYYYIFKVIYDLDKDQWFELLNDTVQSSSHHFSQEDLSGIYFHVINHCIRRFNSGVRSYGDLLMHYYTEGLEKGYLLTHGFLSRNTYRNFCTVAIRLQRYQEAETVSERFASSLRSEDRSSAYHFNLANIRYSLQQYDDALVHLRDVNFDDHLSNLFAKTLLLKIYYESNQHRVLDSHLDAMKAYLLRKKLIGYHKTNYSNIIRYTRRILQLKPYDTKTKQKLIASIQNEEILTDKSWLLAQAKKYH
jgi:hypothetical protein